MIGPLEVVLLRRIGAKLLSLLLTGLSKLMHVSGLPVNHHVPPPHHPPKIHGYRKNWI
ncbi:hypothetical protein Gohar_006208 [Gossypium harknessii]|uniref:Uncharacterized protein n=1 Tax=Gossypium harknessii TaxID=34285 RepID=A0A7J9GCN6_9ROSI|nr:hypothetical protein [Gossypium harknessii]